MGINLYEVIKYYNFKGVPLDRVKKITKDLLISLDHLHRVCRIVHTDIKPENALLALDGTVGFKEIDKFKVLAENESLPKVKLADLGNACWLGKRYDYCIQTREYRAPEVIIRHSFDEAADIWSLGCMVFELITGDYLFQPEAKNNYGKSDDHLAQIIELIGYPHTSFALSGKDSREYFNKNGQLKKFKNLSFYPLQSVLKKRYKVKESSLLSKFLLQMIQWEPAKRSTAKDLLTHPWLTYENDDSDGYITISEDSEKFMESKFGDEMGNDGV